MPEYTPAVTGDQESGAAADSQDVILRVSGLAKAFGATQALRDCSLELRRGEVLALMGENGSGKSTLVKILSGVHRPDTGTIRDRRPRAEPHRLPARCRRCRDRDGLPGDPGRGPAVRARERVARAGRARAPPAATPCERARAAETLAQLIDAPRLAVAADRLPLSDRQAACIARALLWEPRVLILDEATSTLDVQTRDRLFAVLRRLCAEGVGVLYISHRMDEVEEIADRITVMRSGDTVATRERGQFSVREIVELMTGIKDAAPRCMPATPAGERVQPGVVLRASGVRLHANARRRSMSRSAPASWSASPAWRATGRISSCGSSPASAPFDGRGHLRDRRGASVRCARPPTPLADGIAYVPRDRRGESIFESRSIVDNFQVTTVKADRRRGLVRRRLAEERFERYVDTLKIRAGHRTNRITSLSGGNQQKVVIARWLATSPRVLLLNDPTRGVDVGTKTDIYHVLTRAAADGVAVVMLSTEVIELVELMDRVLVFREGELFRELPRTS